MYQRREYFNSSLMYRQHWLQFTRLKTFSNFYSFIWLICNTSFFGFHIRQSLSSVFSFDGHAPQYSHWGNFGACVSAGEGGPEVSGMFLFLPPWAFFLYLFNPPSLIKNTISIMWLIANNQYSVGHPARIQENPRKRYPMALADLWRHKTMNVTAHFLEIQWFSYKCMKCHCYN